MASGTEFLDLPTEVRRMIFKELFTGVTIGPTNCGFTNNESVPKNLLTAIFDTCHTCHDEARPIFFETVMFHAEHADTFLDLFSFFEGYNKEHVRGPLLLLSPKLSQAEIGLVRHLEIPNTIQEELDLPALFPKLRSLTISHFGAGMISKNLVHLPSGGPVEFLHNGLLKEHCAELARCQLGCDVETKAVEVRRLFSISRSAFATARLMLHERNKNGKRYKIALEILVFLILQGSDWRQGIQFHYEVDTGKVEFEKDAVSELAEDLEEGLTGRSTDDGPFMSSLMWQ